MLKREDLIRKYYEFINSDYTEFDKFALDIFRYQSEFNPVYRTFLDYLGFNANGVKHINDIPFLPVSLFKKHIIQSGLWKPEKIFESSSTTGFNTSKHYVKELSFYLGNAKMNFEDSFGNIEDFCFLALLPSYLERNTSSLVYMVDYFIKQSGCGKFYKYESEKLLQDILTYEGNKKVVIIGVTYALLEMAENYPNSLKDVIIMETGGMKGRRKELPRIELHNILKKAFEVENIYSEYGMTELLSQSYSEGNGVFKTSPTMKILFSDIYDPFSYVEEGRQGKINVIDLANIDTCSFLSTDDLGKNLGKGEFEVLGRTDESDIRGCNLLYV